MANLFSTGDRALVISGGKFGERWGEICRAYGVKAVTLEVPGAMRLSRVNVAAALARDDLIRGVCVQACETSTGAAHDVRALGKSSRRIPRPCSWWTRCPHLVPLMSARMSGGSMPSSPAHKRP